MKGSNITFKVKVSVNITADNIQKELVENLKKEYVKSLKKRIKELNEIYATRTENEITEM